MAGGPLDRSETWSDDERRATQWRRLARALPELLLTNVFYGRKLADAGIRDVRELGSVRELPLTTKADLSTDQTEHPPFGSNLTYPVERDDRPAAPCPGHRRVVAVVARLLATDLQRSWSRQPRPDLLRVLVRPLRRLLVRVRGSRAAGRSLPHRRRDVIGRALGGHHRRGSNGADVHADLCPEACRGSARGGHRFRPLRAARIDTRRRARGVDPSDARAARDGARRHVV